MSKKYSSRRVNPTSISAGANPVVSGYTQGKIAKAKQKQRKKAIKELVKRQLAELQSGSISE